MFTIGDRDPLGFPQVKGLGVYQVAPRPAQAEGGKQRRARLKKTNTGGLMAQEFDPIQWIVPGYIAEGFSVLAGRQKLGKTWLAIDWALAVASQGTAMGSIPVD